MAHGNGNHLIYFVNSVKKYVRQKKKKYWKGKQNMELHSVGKSMYKGVDGMYF